MKDELLSEEGQSIIEFLVFLPFMLMMYSVSLQLANAINASINQQKISRSYYYFRLANNSTMPKPVRDGSLDPTAAWSVFGMSMLGFADRLEEGGTGDGQPVAPCYKLHLPIGENDDDVCDEPYSGTSTQFIRVQTAYGLCGTTYVKDGTYNIPYPRGADTGTAPSHCILAN